MEIEAARLGHVGEKAAIRSVFGCVRLDESSWASPNVEIAGVSNAMWRQRWGPDLGTKLGFACQVLPAGKSRSLGPLDGFRVDCDRINAVVVVVTEERECGRGREVYPVFGVFIFRSEFWMLPGNL